MITLSVIFLDWSVNIVNPELIEAYYKCLEEQESIYLAGVFVRNTDGYIFKLNRRWEYVDSPIPTYGIICEVSIGGSTIEIADKGRVSRNIRNRTYEVTKIFLSAFHAGGFKLRFYKLS